MLEILSTILYFSNVKADLHGALGN